MSDKALEKIAANKKSKETALDLSGLLNELNCTQALSELSSCIWLTQLNLSLNPINDLTPIQGLSQLLELDCSYTRVADLAPLHGLSRLHQLACSDTPVADLAPIQGLSQLQQLDCSQTSVADLTPLQGLSQLRELVCYGTSVADLAPLQGLSQLQQLDCSQNSVADLAPLQGLSQLRELVCYGTSVADLAPLQDLSQLQQFECSNTSVTDLTPLQGLSQLQQLGCSNTSVTDLTPLQGLSQLQQLDCSNTSVTDLTPLQGLSQLQWLHCSGTSVADFTPLQGLSQLQQLKCSNTSVTDLTPLQGLSQLQRLYCSNTSVADLAPLQDLSQLQQLDCSGTSIADLAPLQDLSQLQQLYCSNTSVTDLAPLQGLSQLQQLDCSGTSIADLAPLQGLSQLQRLECSNTSVTDLTPLQDLSQLQRLECSNTSVTDLAPLQGLSQLKLLECSNTSVTDLTPLQDLSQLQRLGCSNTQLAELTPLKNLKELNWLNFSNTQIGDLSPCLNLLRKRIRIHYQSMSLFMGIRGFNVNGCPLVCPPVEIVQDSTQAVLDYFDEIGETGIQLNEVKVILLGEASAGKTSLVKRLMNEPFNLKESQTHGIRIRKAPFMMANADTVIAHLWDFGGQEVMHATHQFFLSQRSIYVLLLNSRNDDQAEKWLKHAESFGGDSPVLVVLNKIDENPSFEVERKSLSEKYPQIRGFFRLSCAEADHSGLVEFKSALRQEIDRSITRRTPFPVHWLRVKQHFSDMTEDYIESAEYRRVCQQMGVDKPLSQDVLLQFLHDLGIVINFRNLQYYDTQILNPLWLTNGVYRIINSKRVAELGGLLHESDFDAVINDPRYQNQDNVVKAFCYPKNKLHYIVRVMQEFELCFRLNDNTFVVPQLLPVTAPDFAFEGSVLHFVMHFPGFMPESIFPRLMVKLHAFIQGNFRWRTGMILAKPNVFNAKARIRWDKEDRKILIDACGEERRRLLSFIRETVKEIQQGFSNLDFVELVPIPGCNEFIDYDYLVDADKAGEKEIFIRQLKKRMPISDLLDGVEEPSMRDELGQLPVKAFVSYSSKDLDHLNSLKSALAPLIRLKKLQLWYDRSIDAGVEWRKELFQQLESADMVLCLISSDFVASDFCYQQEFEATLTDHRKGEKTIVPIRLRKANIKSLPLAEIQGTPAEWITSAGNRDEAWTEVSEKVDVVLEKIKKLKKAKLDKEREIYL